MKGIENIEKKILDEANLKAESIIKEAEEKASSIKTSYEEKTRREITLINEKNVLWLQDIYIKARQADQMERRKRLSGERHKIVMEAFSMALDTILNLNDEDYFRFLYKVASDVTKDRLGGELIFNEKDRKKFGQKVCNKLNSDHMAEKVSHVVSSAAGDFKDGKAPDIKSITSIVKEGLSGKMVTLSDETANIAGGVIVRRGDIEYNCDAAVIIRILSEDLASEVHDRLFPKGA